MKKHKEAKRLGNKLKLLIECPIIIGVLVNLIVCFSIFYWNAASWQTKLDSDVNKFYQTQIGLISQTRANKTSVFLSNAHEILSLIETFYDSIANKSIQSTNTIIPYIVNVYDYMKNPSKYRNAFTIIGNPKRDYEYSNESPNMNLFLYLMGKVKFPSMIQIGMIFDNGNEYRFPSVSVPYVIKNTLIQPCGIHFDPRCYQGYRSNNLIISNNFTVYFENNLTLFLKSSGKAASLYIDNDYFNKIDQDLQHYSFIVTSIARNLTFKKENYSIEEVFNVSAVKDVFTDDSLLKKKLSDAMASLSVKDYSGQYQGLNSDYYISYSPIGIKKKPNAADLIAISILNRFLVRKYFREFADIIYHKIQKHLVLCLLILLYSFMILLLISYSIHSRVVRPLTVLEKVRILDMKNAFGIGLNKEIIEINEHLNWLKVIEKSSDPNFFYTPNLIKRCKNLKSYESLLMLTGNKKGLKIVHNLIGNALYESGRFEEATKYYKKSLDSSQEMKKMLEEQEDRENTLAEEEAKCLGEKYNYRLNSWNNEKKIIVHEVSEKMQQYCMALRALVQTTKSDEYAKSRWQKLLKYQVLLLENYLSSCESLFKLLKLLIDIAYTYYMLNWNYSSLKILDIVADELKKILQLYKDLMNSDDEIEIDIDITRLLSANIKLNVKDIRQRVFKFEKFTFERDILLQELLFLRGKIFQAMGDFSEAGSLFIGSMVIYIQANTNFYLPALRKACIDEIYYIFEIGNEKLNLPQLERLHSSHFLHGLSIVLHLGYNIKTESNLNKSILDLSIHMTQSQECNFGAYICAKNFNKFLDVVPRDNPYSDLESLFIDYINSKNLPRQDHIFDVVYQGLMMMPGFSTQRILVILISNVSDRPSMVKIEELRPFLHACKVVIAELSDQPHALCEQLCRMYKISIVTLQSTLQTFMSDIQKAILFN